MGTSIQATVYATVVLFFHHTCAVSKRLTDWAGFGVLLVFPNLTSCLDLNVYFSSIIISRWVLLTYCDHLKWLTTPRPADWYSYQTVSQTLIITLCIAFWVYYTIVTCIWSATINLNWICFCAGMTQWSVLAACGPVLLLKVTIKTVHCPHSTVEAYRCHWIVSTMNSLRTVNFATDLSAMYYHMNSISIATPKCQVCTLWRAV